MMKQLSKFSLAIAFASLLSACGGDAEPESKPQGHVWKPQTDQLQNARDTAEDVNRLLQNRENQIEQR